MSKHESLVRLHHMLDYAREALALSRDVTITTLT